MITGVGVRCEGGPADLRAGIRWTVRKVRGSARALMRGPLDGFVRDLGGPLVYCLVGVLSTGSVVLLGRAWGSRGSDVNNEEKRCFDSEGLQV